MATGPATHTYDYGHSPQSTGNGRNEIVRFQPGVPEQLTVTTRPDTAIQVAGNYGPQWIYFAEDSKMFYADAGLHAALTQAHAEGKLQPDVTITKHKAANNRVTWRFEPQAPPQAPPQPRNPQEAQATKSASRSVESARLLDLYLQSVELAAHAKQYAASRGLLVEPSFEDLRCIAATLFIQERGK